MAPQRTVMRSLGLLTGDLWKALTGKRPAPPKQRPPRPAITETRTIRREVREQALDTPRGQVILRRTTIDEVERVQE